MVRQRKEEKVEPVLPPDKAIELLQKQISQIDILLTKRHNDPELKAWRNFTEQVIIKTFGKPHENLNAYHSALHGGSWWMNMPEEAIQKNYVDNLHVIKKLLEGFIEQIRSFSGITKSEKISDIPSSNKIFIVHGHDEKSKNELVLMLTRFGLEPIILHEKPSEGMTIIEKLEKHSDVGFAFILLTPDDAGCCKDELREISEISTIIKASDQKYYEDTFNPRARQNVVFEFGLFVGKLGRSRTCCLYTGDVELPSDLSGIIYIPFQTTVNEKTLAIAKELKAVGYEIKLL